MIREQTEKPLIAIVLAVYEPRMDWLREQLESLNAQTYSNLRLYIRDDSSPTVPFQDIQRIVDECITNFPYEVTRNEANLGSNRTFELLTQDADVELLAYCDQDDVWMSEKLEVLEQILSQRGAALSYCDMAVIDGYGHEIVDSLRQLRPRLHYVEGPALAESYFFRNCTAGCSMLVRADVAKRAIPFPRGTVHDQWLTIVAAQCGEIAFVNRPLVNYRQHGGNQTGLLGGVTDKKSYREKRVLPLAERLNAYRRYAEPSKAVESFVEGRLAGQIWTIWKYRQLSPYDAMVEIGMLLLPEWIFRICLGWGR